MAGTDRRPTDEDGYGRAGYDRALREFVEHQVVDAAEAVLGHAWIAELERMRRESADLVARAVANAQAGRRLVRAAQVDGDLGRLVCAQELLERSEGDLAGALAESHRTLPMVEQELDRLNRATSARIRRRRTDLERLHAAHADAPGTPFTG